MRIVLQSVVTITCQGVEKVPQLVLVLIEVGVGDHACDVLAVEVVVGGVDVPDAPVGVVVAVGAGAEGPRGPEGGRLPVLVVMREAVHLHILSR